MIVPTDERVSSKGSGVTEGVRRTTGVTPLGANLNPPDPEVVEMKPRRKFTAQYKLPRVPVAENIPGDEMPMFRELWKHIGKKMPKKSPR